MSRRHRKLPTAQNALAAYPDDGQLRFIADYNIEPKIIDYLTGHGYAVVPIAKTKAHGAPDSVIYDIAGQHNFMLVTRDQDFLKFGELDIEKSPGVLVLPRSWQKALDHLMTAMPQDASVWRGKVAEYRDADNLLAVHALPLRPSIYKEPLPTAFCYKYAD